MTPHHVLTDSEITADYWRHVWWRACEPDNVLLLLISAVLFFVAVNSFRRLGQ